MIYYLYHMYLFLLLFYKETVYSSLFIPLFDLYLFEKFLS